MVWIRLTTFPKSEYINADYLSSYALAVICLSSMLEPLWELAKKLSAQWEM